MMRPKGWWLAIVGAIVAACQVGRWLLHYIAPCTPVMARPSCRHDTMLADLALMLLPVALLLLRGLMAGVRQIRATRRLVHTIRTTSPGQVSPDILQQAQQVGVAQRLDIVAWERADAFCYGFLRPRICISTGLLALLTPSEVAAVLRHEQHHLQRRDPLRTWLWTILCGACPWLRERAAHAELLRELAADRAVITVHGRAPLASALLKLLTQPSDAHLRGLAVSGVSVTDARINQLLAADQAKLSPHPKVLNHWMLTPLALGTYVVACSVVMGHL